MSNTSLVEAGTATRWQLGQSGNVNGRPVGSRNAFSAGFLKDLAEVWHSHGRKAMEITAATQPSVFFATCARLVPSDVKLTVEQTYGGLSPDDYAVLRAIREAIPNANNRPATEVLSFVLDAVRAHGARTIESA